MRENIILLSSEPTSANFAVLLISIRATYPDSTIFYVFKSRNEDEYNKYNGIVKDGVHYITCRNFFEEKYLKIFRGKCITVFHKLVDYIYCKVSPCLNMIMYSKYEKILRKMSLNIVDKHNVKILFSSNNPYQAHKAAYYISRKRSIIWNQFWLDPLFQKPVSSRLNIIDRCKIHLEKKLFNKASKILVLPEAHRYDPIINKYGDRVHEVEIPYITNRAISNSSSDIIFAGSFVKRLREPEPIFPILKEALHRLDEEIRFVFYVKDRSLYEAVETSSLGRIRFYDYIPREELELLQSKATALMSIGNLNSCQMPSKVVEYISYRKPILFFYVDSNDSSFRYFKEYPNVCYVNINDDVSLNVEKLVKFMKAPLQQVTYEALLEVELFRRSTPEFMANIILN